MIHWHMRLLLLHMLLLRRHSRRDPIAQFLLVKESREEGMETMQLVRRRRPPRLPKQGRVQRYLRKPVHLPTLLPPPWMVLALPVAAAAAVILAAVVASFSS